MKAEAKDQLSICGWIWTKLSSTASSIGTYSPVICKVTTLKWKYDIDQSVSSACDVYSSTSLLFFGVSAGASSRLLLIHWPGERHNEETDGSVDRPVLLSSVDPSLQTAERRRSGGLASLRLSLFCLLSHVLICRADCFSARDSPYRASSGGRALVSLLPKHNQPDRLY